MKRLAIFLVMLTALICSLFIVSSAADLTVTKAQFAGANKNMPVTKVALNAAYKDSKSFNVYTGGLFKNTVKVTLSNGESYSFSSASTKKKVGDYTLTVSATISKDAYDKAVADKAKTIPVSIKCTLENNKIDSVVDAALSLIGKNKTSKTFKVEKPLVSRYVKSIAPVGTLPKSVYAGAEYIEINDVSFDVTYYDDSVRNLECVLSESSTADKRDYELDEVPLGVKLSGTSLVLNYMDSPSYTKAITVKENPYTDIKITGYNFTENGLETISYELTKTNGKTEKRIYNCSSLTTKSNPVPNAVMHSFNGYNVYIKNADAAKNLSTNKDQWVVCISMGKLSDSIVEDAVKKAPVEDSEKETAGFVSFIVSLLQTVLQILFGSGEPVQPAV